MILEVPATQLQIGDLVFDQHHPHITDRITSIGADDPHHQGEICFHAVDPKGHATYLIFPKTGPSVRIHRIVDADPGNVPASAAPDHRDTSDHHQSD